MALQVWLPLTGDFHNQGLDNEMTSITGTGCSFSNDGKIGSCLKLGYTNNLTVPSLAGAKQLSIAYWCRVDTATSTNWLDPIRFYSTDGSTTQYSRQEFYNNCTQIGFWYAGGSLGGWNGVEVGVWNHYATTFNYETGVVEFYINGEKKYTQTNLNTTHYVSGINIRLGDSGLAISENDMRIYDHVLSAKEISELAKGLVLHYPLNRDGFGCDNFYHETGIGPCGAGITSYTNDGYEHHSVWNKGGTARAQSLGFDGRTGPWTVSFDVKSSVAASITVDVCDKTYATSTYGNTLVANQWMHKSYVITTETNQYNTSSAYNGFVDFNFSGSAIVDGTTLDIKNLHVEEGTFETSFIPASGTTLYTAMVLNGTTVPDTSGFGNNGTITGTLSYSSDTPRYNASTQIDGSRITCASGLVSVADPVFSVSLWFRLKSNTSYTSYQDLINFASPSYSNQPFRLEICGSPVGNDIDWFRGPAGSTGGFKVNNTALSRDVWYHTVLVSEGNKRYSYYMNGVKQGTYNGSANTWTPTGSVTIGDSIAGKIDISDFRIYATALSADDILELYHTSASLTDNGTLMAYQFNEV